ncbi:hypothetical protein ILYODFUR_007162 [Ilyodon furcidens]|uniref:Uncharacterized protein n=1 Tax=Ilyodon furcidens TaxID=33524 RepID=A0ABV0UEZ0_9TELE
MKVSGTGGTIKEHWAQLNTVRCLATTLSLSERRCESNQLPRARPSLRTSESHGSRGKQQHTQHTKTSTMTHGSDSGISQGCFASPGTGNLQHWEDNIGSIKYQEMVHNNW